jgi:glutamyl-tRNA reductase
MNVLCFGLNHKTAPVEVRERMAIGQGKLAETNAAIAALPGFEEAVVLSTCNRTEFYAAVREPAAAIGDALHAMERFVRERFHVPDEEMVDFYGLGGLEAARHLFKVSGGLDSMVVGETEIFGQVKTAYREAHASGTTARALNKLFQNAFQIGKFVRSHSHITSGSTSVGAVAVDLAEKIFGKLDHCSVMVIGAGEISRRTAKSLVSRGATGIIVSNRSFDRAVELAEEMGGRAIRFDDCFTAIHDVDIVIASTAAPHAIMHPRDLQPVLRKRRGRPLFIIDIAVPRDIEPEVGDLDGVYLYDIDALEMIAQDGREQREQQIALCTGLIEQQMEKLGLLAPESRSGGASQGKLDDSSDDHGVAHTT